MVRILGNRFTEALKSYDRKDRLHAGYTGLETKRVGGAILCPRKGPGTCLISHAIRLYPRDRGNGRDLSGVCDPDSRRHYRASDHGGATISPGETVARTPNSSHLIQSEAHTRFLRDALTLGQDGWYEVLQVSAFARYHERFPSKSIL